MRSVGIERPISDDEGIGNAAKTLRQLETWFEEVKAERRSIDNAP